MRVKKTSQVYRYWVLRRERAGLRCFMAQSYVLICGFLEDHGDAYQGIICRQTGLNQGNLVRYMDNLCRMKLVDWVDGGTPPGGGHQMKVYHITDYGRKFLDLLQQYDAGETYLGVLAACTGPYFARVNPSIRALHKLSR